MNEPASLRDRLIAAIERRAAQLDEPVRALLQQRLAALIEGDHPAHASSAASAAAASAEAADAVGMPGAADATERPGPLRALVDRLDAHAATRGRDRVVIDGPAAPAAALASEPEALRTLRRTWSKLHAEQRLTQSSARLPGNAGPLNSHQLVHRALTLMREQSPEYLNRFVGYVDALLWLDALNDGR